MIFTFLHAADLHLGSPLLGLSNKDETVAQRFAKANRDAFVDLVSVAIEQRVAFVLLAGDLYDGEWKDTSIGLFFNREVARLSRADIPVFFIRGNHDAESEVTRAVPLPDAVHEFPSRKAGTHRLDHLKVAIHGQSFADRAVSENLALGYPAPVPGHFNIGLLHTSCEGHSRHATYAPCTISDLVSRGYDYWALGHVHDYGVLHRDPWVVYSGNLQGRSVRETGPKGAVLVEVEGGRVTDVRPLVLDRARWLDVQVDVDSAQSPEDMLAVVRDSLVGHLGDAAGRMAAVRITLQGPSALHGYLKARLGELRDDVQAVMDHLHEEAWLEALKVATTEPVAPGDPQMLAGMDATAVMAGLEQDANFRRSAGDIIALVKARLPGSIPTDALDDLDAILDDSRAVSIARATNFGAR